MTTTSKQEETKKKQWLFFWGRKTKKRNSQGAHLYPYSGYIASGEDHHSGDRNNQSSSYLEQVT